MSTRPSPGDRIAEDELHALVDGRLGAAEAAQLRDRLAGDPPQQATANAWIGQREALQRAFATPDLESTPAPLLAAAQRAQQLRSGATQWTRWAGMAAAVLLAFGLGWLANVEYARHVAGSPAAQFARQAAVAYAVFQPEVRHPVEVTAAQQEHLVQWLSKRLGRRLKVPDLHAQGFELLGGRLLPGESGARAQFMYQDAAGKRLTLYLGAVKDGGTMDAKETGFRFFDEGGVPAFYWVDQGFGCALSGPLPRGALLELARIAYEQIES